MQNVSHLSLIITILKQYEDVQKESFLIVEPFPFLLANVIKTNIGKFELSSSPIKKKLCLIFEEYIIRWVGDWIRMRKPVDDSSNCIKNGNGWD